MAHIQSSLVIPGARSQVYQYAVNPEAVPDQLKRDIEVEYMGGADLPRPGNEYSFAMVRFGFRQTVVIRIEEVKPEVSLTYRQIEGVFKKWKHTMNFDTHGDRQTLITDLVEYELPLGLLGHLANDLYLRNDLTRLLTNRLERIREHFLSQSAASSE